MPVLRVVGGIFGLLAWAVLLGLQRIWHYTFGWIFRTLAALLDAVSISIPHVHTIRPFGTVSAWLRSLDRNINTELAVAANNAEHLAVWLFSRLHFMFGWLRREVEGLSADVLGFAHRLIAVTIPRLVGRLLRFVWRELRALGRYARKAILRNLRMILSLYKWVGKTFARYAKQLFRLARWAGNELRRHWKAIRGLLKRANWLTKRLTGKTFRGLVADALSGLHLSWLMSNNALRVGKWVVSLDPGDVYEWVKDETEAVDFCKLAGFQYDLAVHVMEPLMVRLVAEQEWYCTLPGDTLPIGVESKPGYLGTWEPIGTPALNIPQVSKRLAPDLPLPQRTIV